MKSIAFNHLGNVSDAEDAVQETFLKVHRSASGFQGGSAFSTWIYRILINTCYDTLRRRKVRPDESALDAILGRTEESGDAGAMRALERHADRCAGCAKDLEEWKQISAAATALRAEWSSEQLWPKIEQLLGAAKDEGAWDTSRPDGAPFDESADREFLLFERDRRAARETARRTAHFAN